MYLTIRRRKSAISVVRLICRGPSAAGVTSKEISPVTLEWMLMKQHIPNESCAKCKWECKFDPLNYLKHFPCMK